MWGDCQIWSRRSGFWGSLKIAHPFPRSLRGHGNGRRNGNTRRVAVYERMQSVTIHQDRTYDYFLDQADHWNPNVNQSQTSHGQLHVTAGFAHTEWTTKPCLLTYHSSYRRLLGLSGGQNFNRALGKHRIREVTRNPPTSQADQRSCSGAPGALRFRQGYGKEYDLQVQSTFTSRLDRFRVQPL
jgi:hypothetical protein